MDHITLMAVRPNRLGGTGRPVAPPATAAAAS